MVYTTTLWGLRSQQRKDDEDDEQTTLMHQSRVNKTGNYRIWPQVEALFNMHTCMHSQTAQTDFKKTETISTKKSMIVAEQI